jgi:hypothetical protein
MGSNMVIKIKEKQELSSGVIRKYSFFRKSAKREEDESTCQIREAAKNIEANVKPAKARR